MGNEQDNTIDKIMNGGNDTRVRDDERGIEAHTKKISYDQNNTNVNDGNDDEKERLTQN